MSLPDARTVPVDETSAERLRATGLRYRTIDVENATEADAFLQAGARGFLEERPAEAALARGRTGLAERRNTGVFQEGAAADAWPIATVNSWVTPLTVPGGEVPMWAISDVTVAASHRRRGIARALLEGELRAAAAIGVPVAGLTVSEATIYGRYGFGSAVPVLRVTVDTRRAGWAGPLPSGRFEYTDRTRLAADLGALHEVARQQRAGQIAGWAGRWERVSGLAPDDKRGAAVRGIRYSDAEGRLRGAMAIDLVENGDGFRFTLKIRHLAAVTAEALAALWHFALSHDLVDTVTADLRPVDDPLPWLVADQRAVEQTVHDHGWLRILDVPAFFAARTCRAPLDVTLRVTDPLGFAEGTWRLRAAAGEHAEATTTDAASDLTLGVDALSALSVGGVSAVRLHAAGRIQGPADAAAALDDALRPERAPTLGLWY